MYRVYSHLKEWWTASSPKIGCIVLTALSGSILQQYITIAIARNFIATLLVLYCYPSTAITSSFFTSTSIVIIPNIVVMTMTLLR